jgi:predicted phage terminase large subunit-like protein
LHCFRTSAATVYIASKGAAPDRNDKEMRLIAQSAVFENGHVLLPKYAPWSAEFVRELTSFPSSKHDDQVDSITQALQYLRKNNVGDL